MRAMKLEPNKLPCIVDIDNDLHALQQAVGGRIETVGLKDGGVMIVDEEGLLKQYSRNDLASIISGRHIYGTALIVGADGDDFDDVSGDYFVYLELNE